MRACVEWDDDDDEDDEVEVEVEDRVRRGETERRGGEGREESREESRVKTEKGRRGKG